MRPRESAITIEHNVLLYRLPFLSPLTRCAIFYNRGNRTNRHYIDSAAAGRLD